MPNSTQDNLEDSLNHLFNKIFSKNRTKVQRQFLYDSKNFCLVVIEYYEIKPKSEYSLKFHFIRWNCLMTSSNNQNKDNLTQEDIKKNIENSNLEDITGYASFSSFMVDSKKQIELQKEEEMPKVDINANFEVVSVTTSTKNYGILFF